MKKLLIIIAFLTTGSLFSAEATETDAGENGQPSMQAVAKQKGLRRPLSKTFDSTVTQFQHVPEDAAISRYETVKAMKTHRYVTSNEIKKAQQKTYVPIQEKKTLLPKRPKAAQKMKSVTEEEAE